jgi:predicted MFS family arabinose efflux permease
VSIAAPPRAPTLSRSTTLLVALACGLAVANIYYAQPLLDELAGEFHLSHGSAGLVTMITQAGYALGLLFLVPLGDLLDRRVLVATQSLLSVVALTAVALAPTTAALLAGLAAVGLLAVVIQVLVAYSASLAGPDTRGRAVGVVTSGIVTGILLARTVSGALADLAGWRAVYLTSAAATLLVTALLRTALPRPPAPSARISYPRLIGSVFRLLLEVPVLRQRGLLAALSFAALTTLLTPLALPLSAPPFSLSTTEIGLFGLAAAAGALGAANSGRLSDRGHAQRVAGIGLTLMLAAWLPAALLPQSLWFLVIGLIAFDFGLQSVHVANQSLIYRVRPESQSRLTAAYMLFYSLGSAAGSITSTIVYARAGWTGVCLLGAAITLTALLFWFVHRRQS